jgi:hypothetical protein
LLGGGIFGRHGRNSAFPFGLSLGIAAVLSAQTVPFGPRMPE